MLIEKSKGEEPAPEGPSMGAPSGLDGCVCVCVALRRRAVLLWALVHRNAPMEGLAMNW